jgi:hypothetical protein
MKVVGICGLAGSGKDTAAKALIDNGYTRIAFGDSVKEALLKLDPVVIASHGKSGISPSSGLPVTWANRLSKLVNAVGWDEARKSNDVRSLLQILATEVVRNMVDKDAWVKLAMQRMEQSILEGAEPKFVITDIRFENEAAMVSSLGGIIIFINRVGLETESIVYSHSSEMFDGRKHSDMTIDNTGTIEDLHSQILNICGVTNHEALEV